GYHHLADQRTLLGIPHFWNVASNLPFLIIGALGLALLRRRPAGASLAWAVTFGGTALVCFGSAYYHLDPSDATLVWDRLPIGVAFMGLFAALIGEHSRIDGNRLLLPLIVLSSGAVYWWRFTGDLSLWVWVQLAPMLATILVLFLPGRYSHRRYLAYALGWYVLAKALELRDAQVMAWTGGALSGHSLKHLAAAAGVLCLYAMLRMRSASLPAARAGAPAAPGR
ncbi:MAG TPA: ceramidase domain-containing protein, partial [Burkholderiales bacterium]|nr:ceramidase domain-containing protein [Burkholderiales bacterium]